MARYLCSVCGYIYDEATEPVPWDQLPANWVCPLCGSDKSYFQLMEETLGSVPIASATSPKSVTSEKRICSVCGYVIEAGHNPDVCPACGFPQTVFKPYADRISPKRRRIINFHFHNMIVHFPQAFALFIFFALGISFLLPATWEIRLIITAQVLSIFLPLSVVAALISGILDGKTRFKRLTTPILKAKMVVGFLFLLCSIVTLLVLHLTDLELYWRFTGLVLTALCSGATAFLGHNGGRLACAIVPD